MRGNKERGQKGEKGSDYKQRLMERMKQMRGSSSQKQGWGNKSWGNKS